MEKDVWQSLFSFFSAACGRHVFQDMPGKSGCTGQKADSGTLSFFVQDGVHGKNSVFLIKTSFKKGKEPLTYGTE